MTPKVSILTFPVTISSVQAASVKFGIGWKAEERAVENFIRRRDSPLVEVAARDLLKIADQAESGPGIWSQSPQNIAFRKAFSDLVGFNPKPEAGMFMIPTVWCDILVLNEDGSEIYHVPALSFEVFVSITHAMKMCCEEFQKGILTVGAFKVGRLIFAVYDIRALPWDIALHLVTHTNTAEIPQCGQGQIRPIDFLGFGDGSAALH